MSHVASSYSTGPVISRTFGPMGLLRDQGFGTVFVAAIRDRGVPSGLLVLAGPDAGIIEPEAVQALELLCVLAGVTLAADRTELSRSRRRRPPRPGSAVPLRGRIRLLGTPTVVPEILRRQACHGPARPASARRWSYQW